MRRMWKKLRYRLEHGGLLLAARLIPLLPYSLVNLIARGGGAVAAMVDRPGRRVAKANLHAAFGDKYSPGEERCIIRQSYQHFARTMLELMWSPRLTPANFQDYIELGPADVRADESLIMACYHYSNFEWLGLACGFGFRQGTILAQEFKNALLDPIFRKWREQSGHSFIPRTGGIVRLYKVLRRGGNTAMLVDLTVPAGTSAVSINCFGLKTSVTSAHAWLHQVSGAVLIPAHCEPLPRGRYRVVFHPRVQLGENATLREIAQACWDSFEPVLHANPAPWLWMYKHWRYRPQNPDREYPFYSSPHHKFEPMLAIK